MTNTKRHAIIVSGDVSTVMRAYSKAASTLERLCAVSTPVFSESLATFVVAPNGSTNVSVQHNAGVARNHFVEYLRGFNPYYIQWVEVEYGGSENDIDGEARVTRDPLKGFSLGEHLGSIPRSLSELADHAFGRPVEQPYPAPSSAHNPRNFAQIVREVRESLERIEEITDSVASIHLAASLTDVLDMAVKQQEQIQDLEAKVNRRPDYSY